ncbi:DUF3040 domain-containing protein [Pseudonocardia petroleophila]|uniref:DUF3040 domain-containing protein n=2 Tax=Pseudonocardia petroleophila TaxID=37331 RepID=A0A7G7MIW2_9PSEU|nr:DUF3040 domain-containing protein [Pseudonocardia petroleophila]
MISDRDRRALADIERQTHALDPELCDRLRGPGRGAGRGARLLDRATSIPAIADWALALGAALRLGMSLTSSAWTRRSSGREDRRHDRSPHGRSAADAPTVFRMRELRSEDLLGATAWYRDGSRIGPVTGVHVDADFGRPVWASVPDRRLVPLCRAELTADRRLLVALPTPVVETAPPLPPGVQEIDRAFEDALYAHYAAALLGVAGGGVGGRSSG